MVEAEKSCMRRTDKMVEIYEIRRKL